MQISNILKVCVQNVLHVLEYKLYKKTRTPLLDRFIDEQVLEMFPHLIRCMRLQWVNVVHDPAAVHMLLQFTPNFVVYSELRSGLLAGHRAGAMKSGVRVNSCTRSHIDCVNRVSLPYTNDCSITRNAVLKIFIHQLTGSERKKNLKKRN